MKKLLVILLACLFALSCSSSIKRIRYRDINNNPILSRPQMVYTDLGLDRNYYTGTMVIDKSIYGLTSPLTSYSQRRNDEELRKIFQKHALKTIEEECYRTNSSIAYVNLNKIEISSSPFIVFFRLTNMKVTADLYAINSPAPDSSGKRHDAESNQ